jgi:hypothetical protein
MHALLATLALVGGAIATIRWAQVARSARQRRRAADREAEAAELRREAENAELVIRRLEALQRETDFNVTACKQEAQEVLEQLRQQFR